MKRYRKLSEQFTSLQKIVENIVSNLAFTKDQNLKNTLAQHLFSSGLIKREN
jgi:hypothetical protein